MLPRSQEHVWNLLLGLCIFIPSHLVQCKEKETVLEDTTSELEMEQVKPTPDKHAAESPNPNFCDFTFNVPRSGRLCTPRNQVFMPVAQEELDHLKILLEDVGRVLRTLEDTAAVETGKSRYQDIISEALPDVKEANAAFHENLGKFLQELEDHIQTDDLPHLENEKNKIKEHFQIVDHMIQVIGHLAQQLDQESQNLLEALTKPLERSTTLIYGSVLQPSST